LPGSLDKFIRVSLGVEVAREAAFGTRESHEVHRLAGLGFRVPVFFDGRVAL